MPATVDWFMTRWHFYLLALGVCLILYTIREWVEWRAQHWPVVQGTVEWTEVKDGVGWFLSVWNDPIPEIRYSYSVNGKYYTGTCQLYWRNGGALDSSPKGSPILVHYSRSNPSRSSLDLHQIRARGADRL
jgi:hypothetical protein